MNLDDMCNRVLSDYTSTRLIGQGGQKRVYQICDTSRVVKIGVYSNASQLERIQREVSVLGEMDSGYFPKHYNFSLIDNDGFVIEEEYIEGRVLSEVMPISPWTLNDVSRLIKHLIEALGLLWQKDVIHRDVKPDNIILKPDGGIVLIDLGIARLLQETSLTNTNFFMGPCTPAYASPEQLRNAKAQINHRADQFSLGIIASQLLLSGVHPFSEVLVKGDSIPSNILNDNWARDAVKTVSGKHFEIIEKMLSQQPFQRYRTYEKLKSAWK